MPRAEDTLAVVCLPSEMDYNVNSIIFSVSFDILIVATSETGDVFGFSSDCFIILEESETLACTSVTSTDSV
jgi:hypothetical protein